MPLQAKSRIVVLGNREDREWSKSDRLLLFFVLTAFVFSSVSRSNTVGVSNRVTVKTLSARVFFPRRKSLLCGHRLGIRMPPRMNTGSSRRHYMVCVGVLVIGRRKLTLFFVRLDLLRTPTTLASTLGLSMTLWILRLQHQRFRYRWTSMWTTLSIFLKIRRSSCYLNAYYANGLRLILWA